MEVDLHILYRPLPTRLTTPGNSKLSHRPQSQVHHLLVHNFFEPIFSKVFSLLKFARYLQISDKFRSRSSAIQVPCLAFSAQINAMILDSSALCSNCSLFTLSGASLAAISEPVFSIRFCNDSIFASVLSRNGAENLTSPVEGGNRISSFLGGLRPFWGSGS